MKKENSTLSKRLKQYSAFAGAMAAVAGVAHGQVVYTDIPDTVFTPLNPYPGDTLALDLNNDGITDYNFIGWRYSTSSGYSFYIDFGLKMAPFTSSNSNAIAGTIATVGTNLFGMVSRLPLNDDIDGNQNFFEFNSLVNTLGQYKYPIMVSFSNGIVKAGNWLPGDSNYYAGFKFSIGANSYFGWARVDVDSSAASITLKDYAYNSTPGDPLFAGQGSPLAVLSVDKAGEFNILGYEGVANIFVNDGKTDGCIVTVTNMLGETIIKEPLTNRTTRIDLNQYAKGIYLVSVQRGEKNFSKKISFR